MTSLCMGFETLPGLYLLPDDHADAITFMIMQKNLVNIHDLADGYLVLGASTWNNQKEA